MRPDRQTNHVPSDLGTELLTAPQDLSTDGPQPPMALTWAPFVLLTAQILRTFHKQCAVIHNRSEAVFSKPDILRSMNSRPLVDKDFSP